MTASQDDIRRPVFRARTRATRFGDYSGVLAAVTLIAYVCQSGFFGPIRLFLVDSGLEVLWYIPDLLGIACVAAVFVESGIRNYRALFLVFAIMFYMMVGYLVSGSVASVASTFKALVPLFCGLLVDRDIFARPWVKVLLFGLLILACIGVAYSLTGPMPWANLTFEGIGIEQKYKTLQWIEGSRIRSYGFAGDEHGAASSIVTLFFLFSINVRKITFYSVAAVCLVAVEQTTSRTMLLAFVVFVGLHAFTNFNRRADRQFVLKWALRGSFLVIVVPPIMIGIALLFSRDTIPDALLSLWIRSTFTWFVPFTQIDDLAPFALVHGFGLGGFSFGLLQSELAKLYTPVDNFILFNFLAFGTPYIFFYIYQCRRLMGEQDPYRVIIYILTAIEGVTLRGWSDYPFMALYGY